MKSLGLVCFLLAILGSCVSAKKYRQVEEEIIKKEKQTLKLNTRLNEVKSINRQLIDSAQKLQQ